MATKKCCRNILNTFQRKDVVVERFIGSLKIKIYKYMTSI